MSLRVPNPAAPSRFELELPAEDSNFDGILPNGPLAELVVHITLRSFGSANSYLDLHFNLIEASWAVEHLIPHAATFEVVIDSSGHHPVVTLKLKGVAAEAMAVLADCIVLSSRGTFGGPDAQVRLGQLIADVDVYDVNLPTMTPAAPELADWFLSTLVGFANDEWRSEDPPYYQAQMERFPERQVRFYKSFRSADLGGALYGSREGCVLEKTVPLDRFFEAMGWKYRMANFQRADVVAFDGTSLLLADGVVARFPMQDFIRAQICAGFATAAAAAAGESDCYIGPFDWLDGPFSLLPWTFADHRSQKSESLRQCPCYVDADASLIVVEDVHYYHILFEADSLPLPEIKRVSARGVEATSRLAQAIGIGAPHCDWTRLTDESFEQLCYDLIYAHPRFDEQTIRKLGKSRSRDGGRDIEVRERTPWRYETGRKWIFQCKLVKDRSSLGATRVQDVGDMIEQYEAQGFGVFTSGYMDATLYDRLDAICSNRGVQQMHMSVLEIERALTRAPGLKSRYFRRRRG